MSPITVGWKEFADFPDWGLRRVKAKLDTGARSAAVGVREYRLIEVPGGHEVELVLAPYRRRPGRVVVVRVPVVGFRAVRSSNGTAELRPVVELVFRLGPVTRRVPATVADRSRMLVPVLLGRLALGPEFVVDPARKYVLSGTKTPDSPQRHEGHTKGHQEDS
jgi:hypothetical protein